MELYLTEMDYAVAERNGIERLLVYRRVFECGWDAERAINEPVNEKHRPTGEWDKWKGIAVVSHNTYRVRRSRGMSEEAAALTPKRRRGKQLEVCVS